VVAGAIAGEAWFAVEHFISELDQQKALGVVNELLDAVDDETNVIEKRVAQGNIRDADEELLRKELRGMADVLDVCKEKLAAMDKLAPSDALVVMGAWNRGKRIGQRISKVVASILKLQTERHILEHYYKRKSLKNSM
jgi:hypothetical protein